MSQSVSITYFGMDGIGRTVTEAKRDAGAKIERALNGNYWPVMLSAGEHTYIAYRDPCGWNYGRPGDDGAVKRIRSITPATATTTDFSKASAARFATARQNCPRGILSPSAPKDRKSNFGTLKSPLIARLSRRARTHWNIVRGVRSGKEKSATSAPPALAPFGQRRPTKN